ncbi:MAG: YbdD/YjiX family protein [Gemmatimonadaceae bacterium]
MSFMISLFKAFAATLRSIAGVPDYERYLEHMRSAHPGDRAMSRTEFDHSRMNDRYNRAGSRCC